ncbi:MAG: hypothetical protein VKO39_13350 [Cyanobacteriota bacterium]|nr:hypothetical protein [Cyanobacteriota bacterium]
MRSLELARLFRQPQLADHARVNADAVLHGRNQTILLKNISGERALEHHFGGGSHKHQGDHKPADFNQ